MTDHVLTIDLGTSGPKVALFTMGGAFVDGDFTPVELKLLPGGGAEQSPDAWWRGVVGAAQRTMARGSVHAGSVRRGRGDLAVVGDRADRPRRRCRCTTRSSGWTPAAPTT